MVFLLLPLLLHGIENGKREFRKTILSKIYGHIRVYTIRISDHTWES